MISSLCKMEEEGGAMEEAFCDLNICTLSVWVPLTRNVENWPDCPYLKKILLALITPLMIFTKGKEKLCL